MNIDFEQIKIAAYYDELRKIAEDGSTSVKSKLVFPPIEDAVKAALSQQDSVKKGQPVLPSRPLPMNTFNVSDILNQQLDND